MNSQDEDSAQRQLPAGLREIRSEIDQIDAEIVRLLSVRLSAVMRAFQIKRAAGLALLDPDREEQIVDHAVERATELELPKKQVRKIFRQILRISAKAR